jgi:hypothetical protein
MLKIQITGNSQMARNRLKCILAHWFRQHGVRMPRGSAQTAEFTPVGLSKAVDKLRDNLVSLSPELLGDWDAKLQDEKFHLFIEFTGDSLRDQVPMLTLELLYQKYGRALMIAERPHRQMTYRGFMKMTPQERPTTIEVYLAEEMMEPGREKWEEGEPEIETEAVRLIRQALVECLAQIDYEVDQNLLHAIALLDRHLSGWQLPENQLDGGFDREWLEAAMGCELSTYPICYLGHGELAFNASTMEVVLGPERFTSEREALFNITMREQFLHLLEAVGTEAFLRHPEMREIPPELTTPGIDAKVVELQPLPADLKFSPLVQVMGMAVDLIDSLPEGAVALAGKSPLRYAYQAQRSLELFRQDMIESPNGGPPIQLDHPTDQTIILQSGDVALVGSEAARDDVTAYLNRDGLSDPMAVAEFLEKWDANNMLDLVGAEHPRPKEPAYIYRSFQTSRSSSSSNQGTACEEGHLPQPGEPWLPGQL